MRSITRVLTASFDVALLGSSEVVIEQHADRRETEAAAPAISSSLPLPIRVAGIGPVAALQKFANDLGTRTCRQSAQFVQRLFRAELGNVRSLGRQFRGGTVASRLGGRGQRTATSPGGCRSAGTSAQVKSYEKRTLSRRTVPARRCAASGVSGFAAAFTQGFGLWTAQCVDSALCILAGPAFARC